MRLSAPSPIVRRIAPRIASAGGDARDYRSCVDGEGRSAAQAAVRTRRWGALFTDVGLALLLTGAVSAATQDLDETSATLMLAGAASVGVSVPIQFLADRHLARAVWQHNARYAVEPR